MENIPYVHFYNIGGGGGGPHDGTDNRLINNYNKNLFKRKRVCE